MGTRNWRNIGAVIIVSRDNERYNFASIQEAVAWLGWGEINSLRYGHLGNRFCIDDELLFSGSYGGDAYIVLDELGLTIPIWKLKEVFNSLDTRPPKSRVRYGRRRYAFELYQHDRHFRNGSVPGIHNHNWHRGRNSPRLRTQQELRENDFVNNFDEDTLEYRVGARGARFRGYGGVPTKWDDKPLSRKGNNWKNYRKTQWKTTKF